MAVAVAHLDQDRLKAPPEMLPTDAAALSDLAHHAPPFTAALCPVGRYPTGIPVFGLEQRTLRAQAMIVSPCQSPFSFATVTALNSHRQRRPRNAIA